MLSAALLMLTCGWLPDLLKEISPSVPVTLTINFRGWGEASNSGLSLAISSAVPNRYLWLPRQGWQPVNRERQDWLERKLLLPMLGITLLILPVIGAEMLLPEGQLDGSPPLAMLLHLQNQLLHSSEANGIQSNLNYDSMVAGMSPFFMRWFWG